MVIQKPTHRCIDSVSKLPVEMDDRYNNAFVLRAQAKTELGNGHV